MNVNELRTSSYLKKEDVGDGVLVTCGQCEQVNVAKEGAPEELRWALHFTELEKPMILNATNGQILAQITGSEESEGWVGHKVVLYNDPSVSFGGKLTGGIRIRKPRPAAVAPASKAGVRPGSPAMQAAVKAKVVATEADADAVNGGLTPDDSPF